MSNFDATTNIDIQTPTNGADMVTVTSSAQIQSGDFFDGAGGTDTIIVGAIGAGQSFDLRINPSQTAGFHNYERIAFQNTSGVSNVTLLSAQFSTQLTPGLISNKLAVTGVDGTVQHIFIDAAGFISAAGWTFKHWQSASGDAVALLGSGGSDFIIGSSQSDVLDSGTGTDTLRGGGGKDFLSGGGDADFFVFNAKSETPRGVNCDVIKDFSGAGLEFDHINVHAIDANSIVRGNQNFHFIGTQKFHHRAGELHFKVDGDHVLVEGDIDGNGKADFQIEVHNLTNDLISLAKGDFVL